MKFTTLISLLFLLTVSCKAQTDKQKLESLCNLGLQADSLKDYKISIEYYNRMLAIDTINMAGLINRGKALIATSKIKEGFNDFDKAIKHWPNERTYFARAVAYLYLKIDIDSAEKDLNSSIRLNYEPHFTDAYYALSYLDMQKGKYFLAMYYCEIADKRGIQKNISNAIKEGLSKKIGTDVVENFSYNKIMQVIDNLTIYKKLNDSLLATIKEGLTINPDFDSSNKFYIIKVGDSYDEVISNKTRLIFKVDASTLQILNPNGK